MELVKVANVRAGSYGYDNCEALATLIMKDGSQSIWEKADELFVNAIQNEQQNWFDQECIDDEGFADDHEPDDAPMWVTLMFPFDTYDLTVEEARELDREGYVWVTL